MTTLEIPLTQGKIALIDEEDYHLISAYKWHAVNPRNRKSSYARASTYIDKKIGSLRMHRVIMNAPAGVQVDHWSGDGLDNRRSNLRLANNKQNAGNSGIQRNNTSGYVGVTWSKERRRWLAQLEHEGRNFMLGRFKDPVDAAHAYDRKALEIRGAFARLNFPGHSS